jgi:hypothetical protein
MISSLDDLKFEFPRPIQDGEILPFLEYVARVNEANVEAKSETSFRAEYDPTSRLKLRKGKTLEKVTGNFSRCVPYVNVHFTLRMEYKDSDEDYAQKEARGIGFHSLGRDIDEIPNEEEHFIEALKNSSSDYFSQLNSK